MIQNKTMTIKEFIPKRDLVVVEPIELDKGEVVSDTGIITDLSQNDSIINRPATGVVLAVGPDIKDTELGDYVVWEEIAGMEMEFKDGIFLILREESIVGTRR